MNILHINCNYIGTKLHQTMVEHLEDLGINNTVYVPTYDRNIAVIQPNNNVCVSECFNKWDRLVFDYKQNKIIKDIQNKLDITKYDCIHAYTVFTDGNCARILSQKYDIPYVVAVRDTDVNVFFKKMIHLRNRGIKILLDAKQVFFLSEAYRDEVISKYIPVQFKEYILAKCRVIPNGIDDFWHNNLFDNSNIEVTLLDKTIKLIYVGRVNRRKNISLTQRAVTLLLERGYNVTLTVIGDIEDKNLFTKLKQHKNTFFFKAMNKESLIEQYRKHDIFVMPSITETFGLVYAEAMSQGLPVIYSKGQGFDKQFPDGVVGYSVNSNEAYDVVNAVMKITYDYEKIRNNCLNYCGKFKWADICRNYYFIYSNVLYNFKN